MLVLFRIFYSANFLNIGQKIGVPLKEILTCQYSIETVWQVLVQFRIFTFASFVKIGRQNSVAWKVMIDKSNFETETLWPVFFWLTFSNELLNHCLSIFLRVSFTCRSMASIVFENPWSAMLCCASVLRLYKVFNNFLSFVALEFHNDNANMCSYVFFFDVVRNYRLDCFHQCLNWQIFTRGKSLIYEICWFIFFPSVTRWIEIAKVLTFLIFIYQHLKCQFSFCSECSLEVRLDPCTGKLLDQKGHELDMHMINFDVGTLLYSKPQAVFFSSFFGTGSSLLSENI